jgi:hypothetical protein
MDQNISIVLVTAMIMTSSLLFAWMRSRARAAAGAPARAAIRQVELLANENAGLKGQMGRLEERIAVLERIATDPAARTALAIEELR